MMRIALFFAGLVPALAAAAPTTYVCEASTPETPGVVAHVDGNRGHVDGGSFSFSGSASETDDHEAGAPSLTIFGNGEKLRVLTIKIEAKDTLDAWLQMPGVPHTKGPNLFCVRSH